MSHKFLRQLLRDDDVGNLTFYRFSFKYLYLLLILIGLLFLPLDFLLFLDTFGNSTRLIILDFRFLLLFYCDDCFNYFI